LASFCRRHLDVGFKVGLIKSDMTPAFISNIEMDFFVVPNRILYLVDKDYAIHSVYHADTSAGRTMIDNYHYAFEALRANTLVLSAPGDMMKLAGIIRELSMRQ
jgi:hypothetical protein